MADRVGVSMAKRTCSIDGCDRETHARGLCGLHYQKARVSIGFSNLGQCSIAGCTAPVMARSWCSLHWQRWKRHGDPLADARRTRKPCTIEGCADISVARGWCNKHWNRWRNFGDPNLARKPKPPRPFVACSADGCEQAAKIKGYCQPHYHKLHHAVVYRERIATRAKAYRDAHADELREYRRRNAAKIAERNRAWNEANPERRRELDRQFRERNPHKIRQYHATRRAVEMGAEVNDLTAKQWAEIKAAYGHRCAYCHKKSQRLTQDHVVPLSKGGHHTASNVVPACRSCNSRKGVKNAPAYQPLLM